jgi:hypothetical protein
MEVCGHLWPRSALLVRTRGVVKHMDLDGERIQQVPKMMADSSEIGSTVNEEGGAVVSGYGAH